MGLTLKWEKSFFHRIALLWRDKCVYPNLNIFTHHRLRRVVPSFTKTRQRPKILAGGTDLFVKMKKKQILPKVVISLNGIQKLNRIEWDDKEGLKIGHSSPMRLLSIIQSSKKSSTSSLKPVLRSEPVRWEIWELWWVIFVMPPLPQTPLLLY